MTKMKRKKTTTKRRKMKMTKLRKKIRTRYVETVIDHCNIVDVVVAVVD